MNVKGLVELGRVRREKRECSDSRWEKGGGQSGGGGWDGGGCEAGAELGGPGAGLVGATGQE